MIISLLVFSGCGFHLKGVQGSKQVSPEQLTSEQFTLEQRTEIKTIYPLYENVSANFRQEFQQLLIENNQQANDVDSAEIKINFINEKWQRQSLTVSDTGIPVEYRLSVIVSYRVSENDLDQYREISESRDFRSNNSQLLAIDSQQSLLKKQIQQRIARLIVRSLR